MTLLCLLWYCSFPHDNALSHKIVFCPKWDCYVPHETVLSHIRLHFVPHKTFLSCKILLSPTWDLSVPHDTALFHMRLSHEIAKSHIRLLFPILDWSVQGESSPSQMRLVCPTWDWYVPHKTALLSHVRLLLMYFIKHKGFFFTFLGLICHFRDLSMGLGLGRVWDGTGTGPVRDWDGTGT